MKKFATVPQAFNYYSYSINNPVVRIDPTGEDTVSFSGNFSLGFGFLGSVDLSLGIGIGSDGSKGIIYSYRAGTGDGSFLPKGSLTFEISATNQQGIKQLEGPGVDAGLQLCNGMCLGINAERDPNENQFLDKNSMQGYSASIGVGTPSVTPNVGISDTNAIILDPPKFNSNSELINAWVENPDGTVNQIYGTEPIPSEYTKNASMQSETIDLSGRSEKDERSTR